MSLYPCPCCGYLVFDEPPGSYAICPICFWEDDAGQLAYPDGQGGPNAVSLRQAQANFRRLGACEACFVGRVRAPQVGDGRAPGWYPLDGTPPLQRANFSDWPLALRVAYYWMRCQIKAAHK